MGKETEVRQGITLETKIQEYVAWARSQTDRIAAQEATEQDLRALVYQAQHYRFQAGILCEAANFIGDEAERALSKIENEGEKIKLEEALSQIDTLTSLFCEALDKISEAKAPKTEPAPSPAQAGPCWEGPDSDPQSSLHNGSQETGEAPSDTDTLQA